MVEKNFTLPFTFWCLSDTEIEDINIVPLDLSLDLESYWWKVCLFNTLFTGPVIYFDLDIVIQNNFDDLVDRIEDGKILLINNEDYGQIASEPDDFKYYAQINSSVMAFKGGSLNFIFDHFMSNPDYFIIEFMGMDRYLYHFFPNILNYLNFKSDYYFRHRLVARENLREYFDKHNIPLVRDSKFCILTRIHQFEKPYIGLEEFFL